ncbi:MAG: ribonuclease III [Acidobacteriia bacterium]|nr:ribonuclease III [Terriglobia bacterium]
MDERDAESIEERLQYRFRRPELLESALTHRSAMAEGRSTFSRGEARTIGALAMEDNERLEFLGDAVLSLVVSEFLLVSFPGWSEGHLSRSRSRLVNARSLEQAARRLDLGAHLRLGKGEEKTGGRKKPGLLADAFEAVIAAIYLDGGLEPAREFLRRTLFAQALEESGEALSVSDWKSALQEFMQALGRSPAEYRIYSESGPDHLKVFEVEVWSSGERLAAGSGSTKKEAEQQAAQRALELLQEAAGKEGGTWTKRS